MDTTFKHKCEVLDDHGFSSEYMTDEEVEAEYFKLMEDPNNI